MSTYLQLCQKAFQESGGASVGPSTVVGQTGELKNIVDWVADTWTEIQNKHKTWRWMRSTFTVDTAAGDDTYAPTDCTDTRLAAPISRFGNWWPLDECGYSNLTIYLTSAGVAGEIELIQLSWEDFRYRYKRGSQVNGFPLHFAIDPHNNLVFGPKPDAIYTINGEYQMSAQTLSANGDIPEMPDRFHKLIVYKTMEDHGYFNTAQETLMRGVSKGQRLMRQLEVDQLPEVSLAGPAA